MPRRSNIHIRMLNDSTISRVHDRVYICTVKLIGLWSSIQWSTLTICWISNVSTDGIQSTIHISSSLLYVYSLVSLVHVYSWFIALGELHASPHKAYIVIFLVCDIPVFEQKCWGRYDQYQEYMASFTFMGLISHIEKVCSKLPVLVEFTCTLSLVCF